MNLAADTFQTLEQFFEQHQLLRNVINSALVIGALLLVYYLLRRTIQRTRWPTPEARKRWVVMTRNVVVLLLLLGLVVIWAEQLRTLALSLVAIALALVIATKELLLCVGGEILRSSTRLFTVGNRIEIDGVRGDVIDLNLLTTTIMEVGPGHRAHQYTGRAIVVPNSMLLTLPVYNESFTKYYQLHTFSVSVRPDAWADAERWLLEAAQEACAGYIEVARRHIERIGDREGLDTPSAEPRVSLKLDAPDRVDLIVRVPVPVRQKSGIEQQIVRRFMERFEAAGHLRRQGETGA